VVAARRGPGRGRPGDGDVEPEAARRGALDDRVELGPVGRRVGARVGRVEARLGGGVALRRDARPDRVHADRVDAEALQLVEGRVALGRAVGEQQAIVLEDRLLGLGGPGRRGDGREQTDYEHDCDEQSVHQRGLSGVDTRPGRELRRVERLNAAPMIPAALDPLSE
jgi:hypothetical protein